jgi:O-antigen ligase
MKPWQELARIINDDELQPGGSMKPKAWIGIALSFCMALYLIFHYLQYFSNVNFLAGSLLLEVVLVAIWRYDKRFIILLMIAFIWAGMNVPLASTWTSARWVVLSAGAVVGFAVWTTTRRLGFNTLHLMAFFCIGAAFVSASYSPFVQMASLKALSLLLLFLYCATGGRLAVLQREDRFFRGLSWVTEITVYVTALCYFGLSLRIWGNPNSLGAVMSVGVFPILLWRWFVSESGLRVRRLFALLLCTYLAFFSGARAGMASILVVTLTLSLCLRQYKLLAKVVAMSLLVLAGVEVFAPRTLDERLVNLKDEVLYKGHKEEGILGSRQTPWEKTIASIKEHPLFGTGYGTSPTGENAVFQSGIVSSSAETAREHGSSYMTIAEWVGLLGGVPFVALLLVTVTNVWRVCAWMSRTRDPRHFSIPLAMVVLAGLVHAGFEDWLFAVGSYICVYFWIFAFLLADLRPAADRVLAAGVVPRVFRTSTAGFGAFVPNP